MATARKPHGIPISSKPVTKIRIRARKHSSLPYEMYLDRDLDRDPEQVPESPAPRSAHVIRISETAIPRADALPTPIRPAEYVRKKVRVAILDGCAHADHIAIRFDPHPAIYKNRKVEHMRDPVRSDVGYLTYFDWDEELFETVAKECLELGYLAVFLDRHYKEICWMGATEIHVAHYELIVDWSANPDIKPGFHKRNVVCHC
jgi:hypothetical protein